ncbi:hypothetical protein V8G54_035686, partial [Vigna mungo]
RLLIHQEPCTPTTTTICQNICPTFFFLYNHIKKVLHSHINSFLFFSFWYCSLILQYMPLHNVPKTWIESKLKPHLSLSFVLSDNHFYNREIRSTQFEQRQLIFLSKNFYESINELSLLFNLKTYSRLLLF